MELKIPNISNTISLAANLLERYILKELTKHIYVLSGLGADERVFQKIDFNGLTVTFITWEKPNKKETIEEYASKLLKQIKIVKPIIVGLSFGGIMAVEIAKQIETEKVILIASAKTKTEIPLYYRFAGKIKAHKILPSSFLKKSTFLTNWFFGVSSTFEKELLKTILKDTDSNFLTWAIEKIVTWTNQIELKSIYHIHGTADKILPICFVKSDYKVKNGGHFITLNKENELSKLIKKLVWL
jgi:pimeloyl-ACP methyl ester carboxylesterase